jgi:hypothetical protein
VEVADGRCELRRTRPVVTCAEFAGARGYRYYMVEARKEVRHLIEVQPNAQPLDLIRMRPCCKFTMYSIHCTACGKSSQDPCLLGQRTDPDPDIFCANLCTAWETIRTSEESKSGKAAGACPDMSQDSKISLISHPDIGAVVQACYL